MTRCEEHGLFEHRGACPACAHPSLTVRPDYDVGGKLLTASGNDPIRTETLVTLYEVLEERTERGEVTEVFVTADSDPSGTSGGNVVVYDEVTHKPVDNERAARNLLADIVDDATATVAD